MSTPERADRLIRSLCRVTGGLFGVVVIVAIAYARDLNFIFDVAALPDGLKLAAMMSSAVPLIAAPLLVVASFMKPPALRFALLAVPVLIKQAVFAMVYFWATSQMSSAGVPKEPLMIVYWLKYAGYFGMLAVAAYGLGCWASGLPLNWRPLGWTALVLMGVGILWCVAAILITEQMTRGMSSSLGGLVIKPAIRLACLIVSCIAVLKALRSAGNTSRWGVWMMTVPLAALVVQAAFGLVSHGFGVAVIEGLIASIGLTLLNWLALVCFLVFMFPLSVGEAS